MHVMAAKQERGGCEKLVTPLKIFENEEENLLYWQYLQANVRGDFETARKLAKTLSENSRKDPEFQKLLNQLGIQ